MLFAGLVPECKGMKLEIDVPEDMAAILGAASEQLSAEFRLAAAVKWYELGRISQGRAAEIAGVSRAEFIDALVQFSVSPFQDVGGKL